MRILICSLEAPLLPVNGLRLQVGALARELRRDHEVRVLAYRWPDQREEEPDDHLRLVSLPDGGMARAVGSARAALRGRPPSVDRLAEGIRPTLREELARFRPDVVHVTTGRLAALGPDLHGWPTVLAALDAWHLNVEAEAAASPVVRRVALRGVERMVRRFEARAYRAFGAVVVVSDRDRVELERLDPSLPVSVIPNGVDLEAFGHDGSRRDPNRIVFTGVMSYAPNVSAATFLARRVFPLVRSERPTARLAIVGRDPRPEVLALGELEGVEVPGAVPDLRSWLSGSRAFACTMRTGTGIKNKLLEALANGLPCVATPLALQGMRAIPGEHLLVGDEEGALAGHLARVLVDDELAEALGRAGHDYVRANHAWSAVAAEYDRLYRDVISGHRRTGGGPGTPSPS